MKNKIMTILMCGILALGLTACGNKKDKETEQTEAAEQNVAATEESDEEEYVPQTGNFDELQIEEEFSIEVESGEAVAGG